MKGMETWAPQDIETREPDPLRPRSNPKVDAPPGPYMEAEQTPKTPVQAGEHSVDRLLAKIREYEQGSEHLHGLVSRLRGELQVVRAERDLCDGKLARMIGAMARAPQSRLAEQPSYHVMKAMANDRTAERDEALDKLAKAELQIDDVIRERDALRMKLTEARVAESLPSPTAPEGTLARRAWRVLHDLSDDGSEVGTPPYEAHELLRDLTAAAHAANAAQGETAKPDTLSWALETACGRATVRELVGSAGDPDDGRFECVVVPTGKGSVVQAFDTCDAAKAWAEKRLEEERYGNLFP